MSPNTHLLTASDAFPTFSDAEMADRVTRARAEMDARGLDSLVVHGASGIGTSVGQVNVQYLARYAAVVETFLVVPSEGELTMCLAVPFHIPNARALSSVDDIRWGDSLGRAIERLRKVGVAAGRIGIVGTGNVSHAGTTLFHEQWQRLGAELPEASFENATVWFDDLRLTKSDEEIAVMRRAGAWTDVAHEEIAGLTQVGVTPRALRRAMDALAARAGATYPFGHIGAIPMDEPSGYYPDFYPVDEPIADGSLIMTELALGFGNYFAKLWGSYFVGQPTAPHRDLFEVAAAVHRNLRAGLRPGLTGRDVEAFLAPITDAGFEQPANVLVGGWSAMNHPPQMGALPSSLSAPFTQPYLDVPLRPRQTVTIQAWVSIPGTQTGLWVGSSGVITDSGYESFNRYPVDEIRVASGTSRSDRAGSTAVAAPVFFPVRGRVVSVDDERIDVVDTGGTVTHMRLSSDWGVQVMHPIAVTDLEVGRFVGATLRRTGDEAAATELHMFLPGVRMGDGEQPWDRHLGARMVQGDLARVEPTTDGWEVELAHGQGSSTFRAPSDAPVVSIVNEGREHIQVGVDVFILAWPETDGSLRVDAVATGEDGALPPL